MQTFKFSIKCSNSQITIADMIKEQNINEVHIKVQEDVEFEDDGFLGDLYEIELLNPWVAGLIPDITGKVLSEVLSSSGDDDFYDYIPDLMSQLRQLLTQAKAQVEAPHYKRLINNCIKVYNYLLQFQGDENDSNALFEDQGLMPIE